MIAKSTLSTRQSRRLTTDNLIDLTTTTTAGLGVLFVTTAGIVLSYDALWGLARSAGSINPALTWLWPLTLDALAVVASLNVLWAEIRQERDRYAWALVITFTLLSVLFNAAHANLDRLLTLHPLGPALVSAFVGILPPIAAAFALHLLVRLLRRVLERVRLITALADLIARRNQLEQERATAQTEQQQVVALIEDLTGQADHLRAELVALCQEKENLSQTKHSTKKSRQNRPAGATTSPAIETQARAILAERYAAGEELSGAELGRRLGRSDSLGRRLKRKLWSEIVTGTNGTHRPAVPPEPVRPLNGTRSALANLQPKFGSIPANRSKNGHRTGLTVE